MKLVRVLIAAAAALSAAVAVQVSTSSGASATDLNSVHTADCTGCWYIVTH